MDNRLRILQNLSRKDPYNVQLLQQYIMLLENTIGYTKQIKNPEIQNKTNLVALSRLSDQISYILNKLNLPIENVNVSKMLSEETGIEINDTIILNDQIFNLSARLFIDPNELVFLQGASSRLILTAHLHRGPCINTNPDFPGYCSSMIQCIFGSFVRPADQPFDAPFLQNEIDVRLNPDIDYLDAFDQVLYKANSFTGWQAVVETLFTTIEHFGRNNSWEERSAEEVQELWDRHMSGWTSR